MTGNGRTRYSAGFTLLEVMVAVSILAVGVVPLLVTHAQTVANIRRSRELTVAALTARDRLAELEVYGFSALAGPMAFFGPDLDSGFGGEPHQFLQSEEEMGEQKGPFGIRFLKVSVNVKPLFRPAEDTDIRSGISLNTYIVNLYFEEEESKLEP